jgi:hypothetical protein
VHVLARAPNVSVKISEVLDLSDALTATEPVCFTPLISVVVAEALLASAKEVRMARADKLRLLNFIAFSLLSGSAERRSWVREKFRRLPLESQKFLRTQRYLASLRNSAGVVM